MAERPGIMVYFDLIDELRDYTDAEAGQLFRAMLEYGRTGAIPDFSDRGMKTIWRRTQQKIDRDGASYHDRCERAAYAVYVREARKQEIEPMRFEDWQVERYRSITDDIQKNQLVTSNKQPVTSNKQLVNNKINNKADKPPKSQRKFVPPTIEEVDEYCRSRNNGIDAAHFVDYYTANGWSVGKNKMKDWKAAIRNWERRNKQNTQTASGMPSEADYYEGWGDLA